MGIIMSNKETTLNFSQRLEATWLTDVKNYRIKKRTIVTNIGERSAKILAEPTKELQPRTSTILQDVTIDNADSLILTHIPDKINLGGIILDKGWAHLSATVPDFSTEYPLYKSAQYEVGKVKFDPFFATGATTAPKHEHMRCYQVKVNLWFSPENTNCAIHNHHTDPEMLEVHTQIFGVGRMQKFHKQEFDSIYEDVLLGAGMTHVCFAGVKEDGSFYYPWHQYFADTDCIWMAVEYHPQ